MNSTVIGSSIIVDGEITGDEALIIQGTVKGKIAVKESLFVDTSALVEGDVETQTVEVAGQITGNITASDKVQLQKASRVLGDIRAARILIEDGASFKGNVDMDV
jgi:cytoskeletal protein CcmA (bactofilin family)